MTGKECPVDIGQTDGTGFDMVNGTILDIALDVDDIAATVTSMGYGRLLSFDAAQDKGCSHLIIAGFFVQCLTCNLCRIQHFLLRIRLFGMLLPVLREGITDCLAGDLTAGVATHAVTDHKQGSFVFYLYDIETVLVIHPRPFLCKLNVLHTRYYLMSHPLLFKNALHSLQKDGV